jgi:hypothetical protein
LVCITSVLLHSLLFNEEIENLGNILFFSLLSKTIFIFLPLDQPKTKN